MLRDKPFIKEDVCATIEIRQKDEQMGIAPQQSNILHQKLGLKINNCNKSTDAYHNSIDQNQIIQIVACHRIELIDIK